MHVCFSQKTTVNIHKSCNYKYVRARLLDCPEFLDYDTMNTVNLIIFSRKALDKNNNIITRIDSLFSNLKFSDIKKVNVFHFYWAYKPVHDSVAMSNDKKDCPVVPNIKLGSDSWRPFPDHISEFCVKTKIDYFLYIDKRCLFFKNNKRFFNQIVDENNIYNYIVNIHDINGFFNGIQMKYINDGINSKINDVNQEISVLKSQVHSLNIASVPVKKFSISGIVEKNIVLRVDQNTNLESKITNYNSHNYGISGAFHYGLINKESINNGSLMFCVGYQKIKTSFSQQTCAEGSFLVGENLLDNYGELYDRYIDIKQLKEDITINSNRFTLALNYLTSDTRKKEKENKGLDKETGLIFGLLGGIDLGTRVNYTPISSNVSYYGKYRQYNKNDTIFNNIDGFGSKYSFNAEPQSFLNYGFTALYGFNLGCFYRPVFRDLDSDIKKFKLLITIKAGLTRVISAYSNPNFSGDYPLFSGQQYNSFLFRSNYYKYSLFNCSLGISYFL